MTQELDITIPKGNKALLVKYWLILAIASLAAAGLYSLAPVILRGPYFADKFDVEHIFTTALVVHVDLSVLVWFLSIAGALWSLLAQEKQFAIYKVSFILAAIGTNLIALSPFIGDSNPLKNNYIPVLQNATFFIGLSLFACGIIFITCLTLYNYQNAKQNILSAGIYITALITLIALICFVIAHNLTEVPSDGDFLFYYESIFWGGGHVLQYSFTGCMLVVWLWLASLCGIRQILSNKQIFALLAFNLVITLPSPLFYITDMAGHLFTQQMRHGGGIAAVFIGGAICFAALAKTKSNTHHSIKASLLFSIILFGYGGVLGYMISGVNVTIPAHYHGSIVAVTLAFIGLVYYLLPQLGYGKITGKMATAQPYVYGVGQIMHITGLAWMGGYGALRKSAASSHEITNIAPKIMFFSGGMLAIIGGLLFVIVATRSLLQK